MTTVNVSAAFAKDERHYNGLEAIAPDLIKDHAPLTRHVIIAVVERCALKIDDRKGGEMTPTIRLVTVEVMGGDDAELARAMLNRVYRERTGATEDPQMTLFEAGAGVTIDEAMARDGSTPPEREERDPTAGPWPGDPTYQAPADDASSEPTDVPQSAPRGRRAR